MERSVARVQNAWETLAGLDPMWAILTSPGKFGLKWSESEFFESGQLEIDELMNEIGALAANAPRARALDFGCGMGRLSRGLARYYSRVDGVDVAPSMISLARSRNAHVPQCTFHLNAASNLGIFPDDTFDLIYSNIVLQHIQPALALQYVAEFGRCVKDGGLIVFQAPHMRRLNSASLRRYALHAAYSVLPLWAIRAYRTAKYKGIDRTVIDGLPKIPMEIHAISEKKVRKVLGEQFHPLLVTDPHSRNDAFEGRKYYFTKAARGLREGELAGFAFSEPA